ncbi:MAG: MBL fold metallo-hydrolase, partial [Bacilli bacterium]|nr:MBL fold metallo-hydrolase [Bacilli bacterium]
MVYILVGVVSAATISILLFFARRLLWNEEFEVKARRLNLFDEKQVRIAISFANKTREVIRIKDLSLCYILDKKIMIDPGDSVGELDAFLRDSRADIHAVIITHGHFDHMLGTSHIKKTCGAKVYISEPDAPSLWEEKVAACLPYGVTPFEPVQPDILLKEGSVEIEDIPFDVLLSPGHTPGGICLIS